MGALKHVGQRIHILATPFAVSKILYGHFPALGGISEPLHQHLVLHFLCDVEEQLDDFRADFALPRLKLVNLVIATPPFCLAAEFFDAFDQHPAIMAAVPYADSPTAGQLVPKAPEEMLVLFLSGGR